MRDPDIQQHTLFSTMSPDARVPKDHPLRPIRTIVVAALKEMDQDFNALKVRPGLFPGLNSLRFSSSYKDNGQGLLSIFLMAFERIYRGTSPIPTLMLPVGHRADS